jgi:hypothetical protein
MDRCVGLPGYSVLLALEASGRDEGSYNWYATSRCERMMYRSSASMRDKGLSMSLWVVISATMSRANICSSAIDLCSSCGLFENRTIDSR